MVGRHEGETWTGVRELENGRAKEVLKRSRVLESGVVPEWKIERDHFGVGRGGRE